MWTICPQYYIGHLFISNITPTIKGFLVQCNPINNSNTFTDSDCVTTQVILDLKTGCKITSISLTLKVKTKSKLKEKTGSMVITYKMGKSISVLNSWSLNGVLVGELQYSMRSICETTCDNEVLYCLCSYCIAAVDYNAYPFTCTIFAQWVFNFPDIHLLFTM